MNNLFIKKLFISLLSAALLTVLCATSWLDNEDFTVSDALYQRAQAVNGDIVIVGIDDRAIDEIGQMPWDRSVYADAVSYLLSDPNSEPAAIALDVLFTGESDKETDDYFAKVCKRAGNVVVACAGTYGSSIVDDGESFYVNSRSILKWDEPYDALAKAAKLGCINAMVDSDGNIRHVMYEVEVEGKGTFKTMPRVLYELYCDYYGLDVNEPKLTGDFWYLPFTAKAGAYYESISVADLINKTIEPSFFDGKIVLIGPYASGLGDEYRTSIDHADVMYGIEIQANQIDALKNGFFPKEAPEIMQLAILFVISAALLFFLLDRKMVQSLIIWLAVLILSVLACLLLYKAEIILHVLWIPLCSTIIFIGAVAVNYIKALAEKHRVTEAFGKYVDPAVLNQLLKTDQNALALGGKNYDIAVLFVDIRGFTTMSESLAPETIVEILNRYLTLTTECVMRHHGTLDKFVGDCTMAFWNAPLPQEDPIYLACCAAMDMVAGAKELGAELYEKFGRNVDFGIGVHFGPAVVGNIGAAKRMDYTAIGDTVNTASRLESNAPKGTIYISRVVADALGERAETTSLGTSIKLKGKAEGFEVLTLNSLR